MNVIKMNAIKMDKPSVQQRADETNMHIQTMNIPTCEGKTSILPKKRQDIFPHNVATQGQLCFQCSSCNHLARNSILVVCCRWCLCWQPHRASSCTTWVCSTAVPRWLQSIDLPIWLHKSHLSGCLCQRSMELLARPLSCKSSLCHFHILQTQNHLNTTEQSVRDVCTIWWHQCFMDAYVNSCCCLPHVKHKRFL